ncbi:MAG: 4-amino-4-deoxychorismate lyase [Acidimicrobiales bacterium]|nr:MAG: 4-amino-4-deoxychorismate lyase [Acidimicrobiales bacterium]
MEDSVVTWIDGSLVRGEDASVSALDHGLTVGDGVFETLAVLHGKPFAARRHLLRLRRSAGGLDLEVPYSDEELRRAMAEVLEANPSAGRLRITVTAGPGPLGSPRGDRAATVIVAAGPATDRPGPARVVTVPWRRNEHGALVGLKTTSYAENVLALRHAERHGADEALFANTAGNLCEGSGSNVFVVLDGTLLTPPLSSGCLPGITRELLLEEMGDRVEERDVPMSELTRVEEAFLTSSTRMVQPIETIDGRPLPSCPGPLTTAAREALQRVIRRSLDP